jgi:hypothetical protein
VTPDPDGPIQGGDVLAIVAAREAFLRREADLGVEVDDRELLASPLEIVDIVVTNKTVAGKTLQQIDATHDHQGPGVVLRKLIRQGHEMPFTLGTTVDRGDVLQVIGATRDVARAIEVLGYADRFGGRTGAVFMGWASWQASSSGRSAFSSAAYPSASRPAPGPSSPVCWAAISEPSIAPSAESPSPPCGPSTTWGSRSSSRWWGSARVPDSSTA